MPAEEPRQFWIRNDKGKRWGPLTFATIEVLIENQAIVGLLQASRDGVNFWFPGRLPEIRDAFPKDLWGDSVEAVPVEGPSGSGVRAPPTVGAPGSAPPEPEPKPKPPPVVAAPPPVAARPAAPPTQVAAGEGVPESGALAQLPPFRIYYLAATSNQTGKLTLKGANSSYEVFFKKGAPEAVKPSREDEDLGAFLVNKGALAADKLAEARKGAGNFGGDILTTLFGMQLLNPADAFKHIGEHAIGLLARAFSVTRGTFAFDAKAAAPSTAMPLGDRWRLICDMVRAIPVESLKIRLSVRMDAPIMKSGGRVEIGQLKLTALEARAASYFDGVRSLNELCAALPNEADAIVRTAFLLFRFETCSFAHIDESQVAEGEPPEAAASAPLPKAEAPRPTAPPPKVEPPKVAPPKPAPSQVAPPKVEPPKVAPPKPAPSQAAPSHGKGEQPAINPGKPPVLGGPGGKPVVAKPAAPVAKGPGNDPKALQEYLVKMKDQNHFQVLGVPEKANGADVKKAYFQFARSFHPDTAQGAPPEAAKLKAEIFSRINEANSVLSNDAARADYLAAVSAGIDKMDAAKIFASEETFQKACILVKARKYPEALELFDEAIELYDKEGEYYIWRGWSQFLVAADKKVAMPAALKEIDKGLALSPRCAQGVFFKGQMHKLVGDAAAAQKLFRATLELDPNHLEAQRETRQR